MSGRESRYGTCRLENDLDPDERRVGGVGIILIRSGGVVRVEPIGSEGFIDLGPLLKNKTYRFGFTTDGTNMICAE